MKKLSFLIGRWSGDARMLRQTGEWVEAVLTEEAQYKLDGLILTIEGAGFSKADHKPVLQAFGIVCYDDERKIYRMRAFNDGRFLETDVQLGDDGRSLTWGFAADQYRTHALMRIDDKGRWTENHEITIGAQPPRKFMEISVARQ